VEADAHRDVHFITTLPVLAAWRHSRESGNPGDECYGDWMPPYAVMTFTGTELAKQTSSAV
jgi:hypothetical protein